jgi:short-subunit dehydrogenase
MAPLTLITGASSGIGKVFAERFAQEKHDLVIVARRQAELEALAERLRAAHGVTVHVIALDLSAPRAAHTLFAEVQQRGLHVDGLINNAGFGVHGRHAEISPEAVEQMIAVNVTVLTTLTRLFLPGMIERKSGTILNVASTASFQPIPFFSAYAASKAYVLSFSEGLAEEVREYGIKVVCLCPGPTRTEFMDVAGVQTKGLKYVTFMSAEAVVDAGMQAIRRGEVVRIAGALNTLVARSVTFMPRQLVAKVSGQLMKSSQH